MMGGYQTAGSEFILFKDVHDGVDQAYIIQELSFSEDQPTLRPVFILPTGILRSDDSVQVEVVLKVNFNIRANFGRNICCWSARMGSSP